VVAKALAMARELVRATVTTPSTQTATAIATYVMDAFPILWVMDPSVRATVTTPSTKTATDIATNAVDAFQNL
jgi:hypothetical protein